MPDDKKSYRAQIKIKSVLDPVKAKQGPAEVLPFLDQEGLRYGVWDSELKPYIVADTVIDADVSQTSNKGNDGQIFVNRNVTQIYIEGKPVKQRGRGGGYSPQQIASEEARAAVAEILRAGKDYIDADRIKGLVNKALDWCEERMFPAAAPGAAPGAFTKNPAPAKKLPGTADEAWESLGRERDAHRFDNAGKFFTAVYKELGITQSDAITFLEVKTASEITNFDAAWDKLVKITSPVKKG